jgi:Putative DNA-binding domain
MIPAITKSLSELTQLDLETLREKKWPESQNVEFKSGLSAEHGQDPWYKDGKVGDYAKRKLFKEIVAMANSSGGRLFLGVEESSEKPPVAENLRPLPRCDDLAESLERAAYDWIEPPLTPMKVKGVRIGDDGGGVVVFDVPSSHNAPHRSKDLQCYTRRGTESVPMTMYEIQDLTLRLDRRTEAIKRSFEESKTEFEAWAERRRPATQKGVAFRVVAVPTGAPLYVARTFRNPQVILPLRSFRAALDGNENTKVELSAPFSTGGEKPIVRGSRRSYDNDERGHDCTVRCDGRIELWWKRFWSEPSENRIYIGWILADVANAMQMAEAFAAAAGAPGSEYSIEVEAISFSSGVFRPFFLCGWDRIDPIVGEVETPFMQRISLADKDLVLSTLLTDLLDAAGQPIEKATTIRLTD